MHERVELYSYDGIYSTVRKFLLEEFRASTASSREAAAPSTEATKHTTTLLQT